VSHLHQSFYGPHIIPSFADRDIFARYTGVSVGHQAQYCPLVSLNQEARSAADEYSDEDDSHTGNNGGEGPQSASTNEESKDSDHYDGAEESEPDGGVMDEGMSDEDEDGDDGVKF